MATPAGVQLGSGETGSSFLHRVLLDAMARFPELAAAQVPADPKRFKDGFGDVVTRFEAARVASVRRVEVARHLVQATNAALLLDGVPLLAALEEPAAPPLAEVRTGGTRRWVPEVPLDGRVYRGREVLEAIAQLKDAHHLTHAAHQALTWVVERSADGLDLSGHRFAVIGAGAELSPVPVLLAAGATVRWLDVKAPGGLEGSLVTTRGGDDVLNHPRAVLAALKEFAEDGPVHVGLFAYAPGAGRELRLAAGMDAVVHSAGPGVVKTVSLYVSPTSPGELQPEDLDTASLRAAAPAWWQRGFAAARALKGPGSYGQPHAQVARGAISLQGAAYQAAQYLTKLVSSEVLAVDGLAGRPVTVSANVAGITETRSLSHPLFQAAFRGAPAFGVRIFRPETTRALSALLMLHDLLNPDAPGSSARAFESEAHRARALRSQQIHGGAYSLPWQFESAVRTAAVMGLGKRPDLLFRRAKA
ncbi:MAG: hypothetical protein JNJ54_28115 [Myxococcaceae bacterium]|nr:hypothetical protein [Myxococcaceae bacterium]